MAIYGQIHIKNIIPKLENLFHRSQNYVNVTMTENYHSDIDGLHLFLTTDAARFKFIIGILDFLITLDRFDVEYATMSLEKFNIVPSDVHIKALMRILYYVKKFQQREFIFNTSFCTILSMTQKTMINGKYNTQALISS